MAKKKTSTKQKKSLPKAQNKRRVIKKMDNHKKKKIVLREDANISEYDPLPNLLDKDKLGAAIAECLFDNDTEGLMEVIEGYLYAVNKANLLKKANLSKSTFYHSIKSKNPTIKTLAKIMSAAAK